MATFIELVALRMPARGGGAPREAPRQAALHGVTLGVAAGSSLAVLGPAGAGKTALLMALAGRSRPEGGDIRSEGASLLGLPAHRRGFGAVWGEAELLPRIGLFENIGFPLRLRRLSRTDMAARVRELLAESGLDGPDRPIEALSAAERQRAALAQALAGEPLALLLDEPFARLEPRDRDAVQQTLRHVQTARKLTLIHATRDVGEALSLGGRVALLREGRLVQEAMPQELYERPATLFAAAFVGDNNLLPGELDAAVEDDLGTVRLDCGATIEAGIADAVPGQRCIVAIRPERVAVVAADPRDLGPGAVAASLREIIYRGDHLRLEFRIGRETGIVAKRPAPMGSGGLVPGREVALAWPPQYATAFAPGR